MNMLRQAEMPHTEPGLLLSPQKEVGRIGRLRRILPGLETPQTDAKRERQKEVIGKLFPEDADLGRLIADIPASYAEQFAEVIGSTDFAEERLAGLLAALNRLVTEIQSEQIRTEEQITEYVREEKHIHEVFEDLVIRCALNSL